MYHSFNIYYAPFICYVNAMPGDGSKKSNETQHLLSGRFEFNTNGAKGNGWRDKGLQNATVIAIDIFVLGGPQLLWCKILDIPYHSQFQI